MKKQLLILAAITAIVFSSCSKEKIEMPETSVTAGDEVSTSSSSNRSYIDPLTINLEGWFKFNKNLKDATGKLQDGVQWPVKRTGVVYTADRKGNPNAAIKLDGNYAIDFPDVPQQNNTSMSIWIKRSVMYPDATIISPNGYGPRLDQNGYIFKGLIQNGWILPEVYSTINLNPRWYHIVITFNGTEMKMYVNGILQGTYNDYPHPFEAGKYHYFLATTLQGFWSGSADDLRFYSRTLTASDVQALYNL